VSLAPVHTKDEIEGVIAAQGRNSGGGLIVLPNALFFDMPIRHLIIALAAHNGVPTVYFNRVFVEAGGLAAYSADFSEELRQAAGYVDRILKGARLTDLPIQQPIKYELVVNLKTANTLGLTIPHNLLVLADEVIE
jgi:putative tryptophan/tyrosine transport system substrate-binding protein